MADTGFKSPTSTAGIEWLNPSNAFSSDDQYAQAFSNYQEDYYNFNFPDLSDAQSIDGIEVAIEHHYEVSGITCGITVELSWNGGTSWTSQKYNGHTSQTTDHITYFGGATDKWGRTWSPSELTNANFRIKVRKHYSDGRYLYVDHIQVKVFYTVSPSTKTHTVDSYLSGGANWLSGWQYRKQLTIDNTKIDSNLTDFPVLVKLTSSNFDFSKAQSSGDDVRFTSSDGTTLLKYERERHDSANQAAEYWVKIPSVSSSSGTTFYIYYGNASASDGEDATNVWDSNFKMVHHLKGATYTDLDDSTSNANDVTTVAGTPDYNTDAKIGKGVQFVSASSERLDVADSADFEVQTATIECWVKATDLTVGQYIVARWANPYHFEIGVNTSVGNSNAFYAAVTDSVGRKDLIEAANESSANTWYHLALVYDGSTDLVAKLYKNGSQIASVNLDGAITVSGTDGIGFAGRYGQTNAPFDGILDEIRFSNVVRSPAWIKATYHSGNDSLLTFGTEETPVVTYTETHTFDAYLYAQNTQAHTVDTLLYKQNAQTNTVDGFLYKTLTVSHTVDSYLPTTRIYTIDSVLYKTYTAGGTYSDPNISYGDDLVNYNGLPTIDAYLYKTTTASVDSVLYKTLTAESSIDSYFRKRLTTSAGIDSCLFAVRSTTFSIDSLLYKTYTTTHTLGSYLYKQKTVENYINTYLWGTLELTYTIDGLLWGWNYQDKSTDPSWNYQNKSTDPSWDYQDKSTDPSWDYQDKSTDPSWTYKDKPTDPTWTWKIKR